MRKVEVLAPAGNFETMQAAVRAGADAVYLGGDLFGARAYAGNLSQEELLRAIDYVHLYHKKLYLTVNTLLKQEELEEQLYQYISPFYQQGLDAVIVQDLGVFSFLHRAFPGLGLHASTQMTVAGPEGARILQRCGASRIVTPRELSLSEIRQIREGCDLEIESFVHGALCYCYSGQCLMSSLIGGRSGNRGRCAQPCRMNYQAYDGKSLASSREASHLLSPKDMNTLDILPEIIEAGVDSLKIEGRMKKPVYTAGVTEIYRKYVDRYRTYGREGYRVAPEDHKQVFDLFNRNGFHKSYYQQHNGKDMMALSEKEFRFGNEQLAERLRKCYLEQEKKLPVRMCLTAKKDIPLLLELSLPEGTPGQEPVKVSVKGQVPDMAKNQAATRESVAKQLGKLGTTVFTPEEIEVRLDQGLFLPVMQLNELRREGVHQLETLICGKYRRKLPETEPSRELSKAIPEKLRKNTSGEGQYIIRGLAVRLEQAEVLLENTVISRIYIESEAGDQKELEIFADRCRKAGKECYLALPYVFRDHARTWFSGWIPGLKTGVFDGYLVRSLDELAWLTENNLGGKESIVADCGLYSWNQEALSFLSRQGVGEAVAPVELNRRELAVRGMEQSEWIIYGRLPMMISAQCVRKNTTGCKPGQGIWTLTDRTGARFPVRFACRYCYNVIYNNRPLSYFSMQEEIRRLSPGALRLSFSVEPPEEVEEILDKCLKEDPGEFTRGHWKRGVE